MNRMKRYALTLLDITVFISMAKNAEEKDQFSYFTNCSEWWQIAIHHIGGKLQSVYVKSDVMLFNNNDVILQSEGEGVKKGQKLRSYLMYGP